MKNTKLTNSIFQGLMMAAVVAAALPFTDPVLAQTTTQQGLGGSSIAIMNGISGIPNIIAGLFYIGGAAMIGAGALQLKNHAENPTQHPLGKGLGRLGAGACLVALPAFASWLTTSLAIGSTTITPLGFGTFSNMN